MDELSAKREKEEARRLRQSRWWQNKLQNPQCYYCGKVVALTQITMDHIVPISDGGKSTKDNLVMCCKTCNNAKKDMNVVDWVNYLKTMSDKA